MCALPPNISPPFSRTHDTLSPQCVHIPCTFCSLQVSYGISDPPLPRASMSDKDRLFLEDPKENAKVSAVFWSLHLLIQAFNLTDRFQGKQGTKEYKFVKDLDLLN